jgi:hypothetical protein
LLHGDQRAILGVELAADEAAGAGGRGAFDAVQQPLIDIIHQYLLGYASDFNFLPVALQPHGVGFLEPGMQVATDEAAGAGGRGAFDAVQQPLIDIKRPMEPHRVIDSVESTSASSARGFVRGEFYTQDGTLVASTVQEGVMRNRPWRKRLQRLTENPSPCSKKPPVGEAFFMRCGCASLRAPALPARAALRSYPLLCSR